MTVLRRVIIQTLNINFLIRSRMGLANLSKANKVRPAVATLAIMRFHLDWLTLMHAGHCFFS